MELEVIILRLLMDPFLILLELMIVRVLWRVYKRRQQKADIVKTPIEFKPMDKVPTDDIYYVNHPKFYPLVKAGAEDLDLPFYVLGDKKIYMVEKGEISAISYTPEESDKKKGQGPEKTH